jgi:hypothetical protein
MVIVFGLQFIELKFHFLLITRIKPNPIIVVPGSIPNMMRSFAILFWYVIFYEDEACSAWACKII